MRHPETDGAPADPEPGTNPPGDPNAPGNTEASDANAAERPELDADEGADAFETLEDSREGEHRSGAEREDEDHISMDTPD